MRILPPNTSKSARERSSMITKRHRKSNVSNLLPAQKKALPLIIVVANVVYVREQRRDTYYRNDPKKYGLNEYAANWGIYIFMYILLHVGPVIDHTYFSVTRPGACGNTYCTKI